MTKATFNGTVVAESNDTIVVEGNHYFPPESIKKEYFSTSDSQTASYYNLSSEKGDAAVPDVAWYYPDTKEAANNIKNYVAFYKDKVQIV